MQNEICQLQIWQESGECTIWDIEIELCTKGVTGYWSLLKYADYLGLNWDVNVYLFVIYNNV